MKIAVITGASSGMGRETAIQIADRFGAIEELWLIARRKELLEELDGHLPAKIRCFAMDITCPQERKLLERALEEEKPDVKFLVNAAGFGKIGSIGENGIEDETGMVRLNCEALCAITHMVLPYMSRNSRILQFGSASAFVPQPGFGIYAATKAFVLSYSRTLGSELKSRRIYVTAVCPGPVDTEFFQVAESSKAMPAYKQWFMANPHKVVKTALKDSMMGRSVSVYGITMKAFWLLCKLVPHSVILKVMEFINEKQTRKGAVWLSGSSQKNTAG